MAEQLLSPEEVATICGLSRKAVYRAVDRGELAATRLCSRIRIRPGDVDRWIDANRVRARVPDLRIPPPTALPDDHGLRRLVAES